MEFEKGNFGQRRYALSDSYAELFPANEQKYRLNRFEPAETEHILQKIIAPSLDMIANRIKKLVSKVDYKIYSKSGRLSVSELGRWFYLSVRIEKYNCIQIAAEYEETLSKQHSGVKIPIGEKIVDYRKGERLTQDIIENYFKDIFFKRIELYHSKIESEKRLREEQKSLQIEQIRAEYLRLRTENDAMDKEMETDSLAAIIRHFMK